MAALEIRAEWPGRVAEIHVSAGDSVVVDQELVTIESMKMLTPVPSPAVGIVQAIAIAIDDFVDEGAVLITLEA
ncbi:MAG: acetyl-CoA carboxylase biotin carboxyl carrier protein subunit [Dehalococcoidia bacterium]|jgi:biotin carboxyl carrier protein